MTQTKRIVDAPSYNTHRKMPAILKSRVIAYTIHYVKGGKLCAFDLMFRGTKDELCTAVKSIAQAVRGDGGGACWAQDVDGLILFGYDARGNACDYELTANLESVRQWHRDHA